MDFNWSGLILGAATFFTIGIFHPIVIKAEYYYGVKVWWIFLLFGIGALFLSLMVEDMVWSSVLGVISFSLFWSIGELFAQKKRVEKGWFPRNPKRKYDDYNFVDEK